jgi:30S ribosomal protein S31
MGQGDRKTRKGKIWRGSYGNTRPHQKRVGKAAVKPTAKKK